MDKDWKLKLRYGKISTDFSHYTIIADGKVFSPNDEFGSEIGPAMMGIKVWAIDGEQAADLAYHVGKHVGFDVNGKIQIFDTDPEEPPGERPHGYNIQFTPYEIE